MCNLIFWFQKWSNTFFSLLASHQSFVVVARRRLQDCHHLLQHWFSARQLRHVTQLVHLGDGKSQSAALHAFPEKSIDMHRVSPKGHKYSREWSVEWTVLFVGHSNRSESSFKHATWSLSPRQRQFSSLDQQQNRNWVLLWWRWRSSYLVGHPQA